MKTINDVPLLRAFETAAHMHGRDRDYIRQLAIRDPSLANELSTLLADDTDGDEPLEQALKGRQPTCDPSTVDSPTPTIPGYIVKWSIGSGGQADVFLALQESTGQDVAIKVFRGCGLADSQRHRIDAETKALARLQLPNVVAILDRGQTTCGREYLVTRFVAGLPIDEAASRFLPENPQAVTELFVKVADTLARVHRQGIIHRDLKPSNILVDRNGEPYLLDFGLASFFADPSGRLLTVTPDEGFQGSILWASPEQVDSSFGVVDQRSDIYSLGVVLYQVLTGRFPYPVEGRIFDVAQQIVRTAPAPIVPSQRAPQFAAAGDFQCVVLRALHKQPHRRYQSADELSAALRKIQHAAPLDVCVAGGERRHLSPYRAGIVCGAVMACAALWPGLNAALFSVDPLNQPAVTDQVKDISGPGITAIDAVAADDSFAQNVDERLAPFGVIPPQWIRVGTLENHYHEIERGGVAIDGDFVLELKMSADRTAQAGFTLTLVGFGGDIDVKISGKKVNTWSDNESWEFRTPAGTILKGLPLGSHTFMLRRQGALATLSADAVHRPDESGTVLATFAASGTGRIQAIRLSTSGPAIQLERLRVHASAAASN